MSSGPGTLLSKADFLKVPLDGRADTETAKGKLEQWTDEVDRVVRQDQGMHGEATGH